MTTNVYIITEEGRSYNEEGIQFIKSTLLDEFKIDDNDIIFNAGAAFNDPAILSKQLKGHTEAYIVVSTADDILFIPKSENAKICENLDADPSASSWETLMRCCGKTIY